MWDNDIILLYRGIMTNMVIDYLENAFLCRFIPEKSEVLSLNVVEFETYVRVTFDLVCVSMDPSRSSDYIHLQGIIDITSHGDIDDRCIHSNYLHSVLEVSDHD